MMCQGLILLALGEEASKVSVNRVISNDAKAFIGDLRQSRQGKK